MSLHSSINNTQRQLPSASCYIVLQTCTFSHLHLSRWVVSSFHVFRLKLGMHFNVPVDTFTVQLIILHFEEFSDLVQDAASSKSLPKSRGTFCLHL